MKNRTQNAFTMVELVFVIVVIGILASIAVPKLAATRDDAVIAKARTTVGFRAQCRGGRAPKDAS